MYYQIGNKITYISKRKKKAGFMSKTRISTVILLISLAGILFSQTVQPAKPFDSDYAVFKADDGLSRLELYLLIPRADLTWEKDNNIWKSRFSLMIQLYYDGQNIFTDYDDLSDSCANPDFLNSGRFKPYQANLTLEPGDYQIKLTLFNTKNVILGKSELNTVIPDLSGNDLLLSSQEFLSFVYEQNRHSIFSKYGNLDVIPKVNNVFDTTPNHLQLLLEIYNIKGKGRQADYSITPRITNLNGEPITTFDKTDLTSENARDVFLNEYDISTLTNGIYQFVVKVTDESGQEAESIKKFFVSGHAGTLNPKDIISDGYSGFTEEQLDSVFKDISVLISKEDSRTYKGSPVDGKRQFLTIFWEKKANEAGTNALLYRNMMEKRIAYANRHFTTMFQTGSISDRGRTLIKYGFPSDIQYYSSTSEGKPHEIWYYDKLEGGVKFIFADLQQLNNFELIHSTKNGEIHNEDWESMLTD